MKPLFFEWISKCHVRNYRRVTSFPGRRGPGAPGGRGPGHGPEAIAAHRLQRAGETGADGAVQERQAGGDEGNMMMISYEML